MNALAPHRFQQAGDAEARAIRSGGWYRLSRAVTRRPAPIATLAAAALILMGLPLLGIKFTQVDASALPTSASARQVADALAREFNPRQTTPITLVARTSPGPQLDPVP